MTLDKSWMNKRGDLEYIEGVKQFVNFVKEDANGEDRFLCPCVRCRNSKGHIELDLISFHLLSNGIDQSYVLWDQHGEKSIESMGHKSTTIQPDPIKEADQPMMEELVDDVFNVNNWENEHELEDMNITLEGGVGGDQTAGFETEMNKSRKYKRYRKMATQPLYNGCPKGKIMLSTIIELQNLKMRYGLTGNSMTAILDWVKSLFVENYNLPKNYPHMKNMIKDLGMECETIHACRNGCILYWKEYKHHHMCPKCGVSRYKLVFEDDSELKKSVRKEAAKFVKCFPLIPRLKRFFSIPWIADAMTWHKKAKTDGNLMRDPCDSGQWDSVNVNWPDFATEARNLRLVISIDGFNPHGTQSSTYSCWLIIVAPLNLSPSLCMKKEFSLLTLLILGSKSPGKHIDVFLQPLVDELKDLWINSVPTRDAFAKTSFTMKAMLIWGVHDLPAYGTLSGCNIHGYKACPVCTDDVDSEHLEDSKKICYRGYRRFLRSDHKFRNDKRFNKFVDHRPTPLRLSGEEVEQQFFEIIESNDGHRLSSVIGKSKKSKTIGQKCKGRVDEDVNLNNNSTIAPPWSRRSILFDLPYWKFLKVCHNIDVMHTEKNVTDHLLSMLMNVTRKTKNGLKARKDLKKLGTNKKLWLVEEKDTGKTSMPKASYALTKEEKEDFCRCLKDLKLPTGFSSNLSNLVTIQPPELRGLK